MKQGTCGPLGNLPQTLIQPQYAGSSSETNHKQILEEAEDGGSGGRKRKRISKNPVSPGSRGLKGKAHGSRAELLAASPLSASHKGGLTSIESCRRRFSQVSTGGELKHGSLSTHV